MAQVEMKTSITGQHYVAHITIEEVVETKSEPAYRNQGSETRERKVNDLGKIIVKDKNLEALISKAKKHLDIIVE